MVCAFDEREWGPVAIAALVTWVITAGFGAFMLLRWISRGGHRKTGSSHFPPIRVFSHFGLAAAGLVVWIIYLVTDSSILAWIAFFDLVLVALLGGLLVMQWTKDGRAAMRAGSGSDGATADLAEQHIPRLPVVVHGIFAVSTVILVLLSAIGVGGS
jgi:preprotein translocase subunit SecG